jgi:hypothetical protein
MKVRRRIAAPKAQGLRGQCRDYSRDLRATEWGRTVILRSNNLPALGHKRTFRSFRPMSALPPKADIRERSCDVRFVP